MMVYSVVPEKEGYKKCSEGLKESSSKAEVE
jgi:hypothetical protein